MVIVTRLNGNEICINADMIERIEATPDTVLTLIDGKKYVVTEDTATVVSRVIEFRAAILVAAEHMQGPNSDRMSAGATYPPARPLRLIHERNDPDHPGDHRHARDRVEDI